MTLWDDVGSQKDKTVTHVLWVVLAEPRTDIHCMSKLEQDMMQHYTKAQLQPSKPTLEQERMHV